MTAMSIIHQPWFSQINRPSRYIGGEINAVHKDPSLTEVSVALAFPDVYEVGMSHLGLKILYHNLNRYDWIAAERVFSPWVDLESELRKRNTPLATLESGRPLSAFDIVGFSLQHELCYTNVLSMLDLSGIPLLSRERGAGDPIVIAGGPACFNPEPVAEIFDAMVIGDGEEPAIEICRTLRSAKKGAFADRRGLLEKLTHITGVYIPSFFSPHYHDDGTLAEVHPELPHYPSVRKSLLPDIDAHPFPDRPVVPFTQLVHDRLAVEIARGCTRGCRFCQAGMIYRPVRERAPGSVLEKVEAGLASTGYEDVSLLSLSCGDYSHIEPLLGALMDRQAGGKIAVSLPSLRVDTLDPGWLQQLKRVRKTGFTLAPEAGNDRLRQVINKDLSNRQILQMASTVYDAGWNLIKLYFMIGLPGETDRDLESIMALARGVAARAGGRGRRPKLNLSVATFVPKAHTPFMWTPQLGLQDAKNRIQALKEGLRDRRIRVKWNDPELSWLEGIFSRGDRRLTPALLEAWRSGARFDAWGEHFHMDTWQRAFERTGIDPHFYLHRERSLEEIMPWEHISSGVRKSYLADEWERAIHAQLTPDCRTGCLDCGVCDHHRIKPVLFDDRSFEAKKPAPTNTKTHIRPFYYRLAFTKLGRAGYLSHLELARSLIRAFRRAGLDLAHSQGFHPMPKVSFAGALPVGTESRHETVDVELNRPPRSDWLLRLNQQLPEGIEVFAVEAISGKEKRQRLSESHFTLTLDGCRLRSEEVRKFFHCDTFPIEKATRKGRKQVDIRPLVGALYLLAPNRVNLIIRHPKGAEARPAEIVRRIFSLGEATAASMNVLKTDQVLR